VSGGRGIRTPGQEWLRASGFQDRPPAHADLHRCMPQRSRPHGFRTEHRDGPSLTGTDRTACDANTIDTDHIMTDGNPARWEPEPPRSRRVRRQVGFSLKLLTPAGLRSIRRGLHRPDWRARRACPTVCERNRRCVRPRRSAHPGRPDPGMHDLAGRGVLQADQLQRRTGSFADSKVASLPPGTIILKVENGAPIKVGRGHIERRRRRHRHAGARVPDGSAPAHRTGRRRRDRGQGTGRSHSAGPRAIPAARSSSVAS